MGDRGNIIIEKDDDCFTAPLYLYTHWNGSGMEEVLAQALVRGVGRWEDPPYLARIIFSEMIADSVREETGFGISNIECDNSHPLLCVNIKEQKVRRRKTIGSKPSKEWTFREFIEGK